MSYERATHPRLQVGQRWRSTPPGRETLLIVALDESPSGLVVNVIVEDGLATRGVGRALAPFDLRVVEPHLGDLIADGVDVAEHLPAYEEWRAAAQAGKAGFWTRAPAEVLALIRENA